MDLLKKMLYVIPEFRITAAEAMSHAYFKGFSVEELINVPISEQMLKYSIVKSNKFEKDSKGSFA